MAKLRTTRITGHSRQKNLFDGSGDTHRDVYLSSLFYDEGEDCYRLGTMCFYVVRDADGRDQMHDKGLVDICLMALRLLRLDTAEPWLDRNQMMQPIAIDLWERQTFIRFLRKSSEARIRLRVSDGSLLISLPHPSRWKTAGLEWIRKPHFCCEDDRNSATPWLNDHRCRRSMGGTQIYR